MKHTTMRMLSWMLVFAMVLSMIPAVYAYDSHITLSDNAVASLEQVEGGLYQVELGTIFSDAQGHKLTYTLDGDFGPHTKITEDGVFAFSVSKEGTYKPVITAACADGDTAQWAPEITVKAAPTGADSQYNYDETPAESVKVIVTIASDGTPLMGNDENGTVLSHLEVEVPYFDLGLYDLSAYYRYATENGSGSYVGDQVIQRPTALHLYIYLLERYYLGLPESQCCKGSKAIFGEGNKGVRDMDGLVAYSDKLSPLYITGGPTSLYMANFWGHDENLMYYRNHVYPLMSPGWGSTCDYMLLSDGDTIDLSMFTNWQFWTHGAFACFEQDSYEAAPGATLKVNTCKFATQEVAEGSSAELEYISGLNVSLYSADYGVLAANAEVEGHTATVTLPETPGVYYLLGIDPNAGTEDACIAPATAKVIVKAEGCPHENVTTVCTPCGNAKHEKVVTCADCNAVVATSVEPCSDANADKLCDLCGGSMNRAPVLAEGVAPTASAQVVVNNAYLLSDLQAGKIFTDPDGDALNYRSYTYQRSADNGQTWSDPISFDEALFGWTTIMLTETQVGTYLYKFSATDGQAVSEETWTLTLEVVATGMWDVTVHVSKDQTGGYPIIRMFKTAGVDENGFDVPDYENEVTFLYNNFTNTLPEGQTAYDPAKGTLDANYNVFYASVEGGMYSYRAYAYNAATGEYDVELGGMSIRIPADANVDGNRGGGTELYLRLQPVYTTTKIGTAYRTADDYYAKVTCPLMGCNATPGTAYKNGNYTYYPFMLYAGGNSCLYNMYVFPKEGKPGAFGAAINATVATGTAVNSAKSIALSDAAVLTVEVPQGGDFGLYYQWNNFNSEKQVPTSVTQADGMTVYTFDVAQGSSNYTWRLTDPSGAHVTQADWLASMKADTTLTLSFDGISADKHSHSFANLGTAVKTRDEADLMVNLDPSGFKAMDESETVRVRAYRHWELINSDAGNIMVEPDFHYSVLSGNASITAVNGGNATGNWLDVNPQGTAIVGVYYDSIEVAPGNHGTHGGTFPATNPERLAVFVVSDTEQGTADAHIAYGRASDASSSRSDEWDYNYDTWFYSAADQAPVLTFTANGTGNVSCQYALVMTDAEMNSTMTGWSDTNGTVDLLAFRTAQTRGGSVILKLTDDTGVSYRVIRVAEVVITATNATNPGEPFMPGDQVSLSFDGLYRAVNKVSGVFNPTTFYLRYSAGEETVNGTLGQYQQMDQASIVLTIPEDISFDGASSVSYGFTNGLIFGSMYSAANPFAFLYNMTDTGVGTNFNAVTVSFTISHLPDASVTVVPRVNYDVEVLVTDGGDALENVSVTVTDPNGQTLTAGEDGLYHGLPYGVYSYRLAKPGYVVTYGTFKLSSSTELTDDVAIVELSMNAAAANAWDGAATAEPELVDGVYQIGTGAELAWLASAVNGGAVNAKAVLTADIDLAGYDWTPIGNNSKKFAGSFDGAGHTISNFRITYTTAGTASPYLGLFGYVAGTASSRASVSNLTLQGSVSLNNGSSVSNAYSGGVMGCADYVDVTNVTADVNVNLVRTAGNWYYIGGIAGNATNAVFTDCANLGDISAYSYAAGIVGRATNGTIVNRCYNVGTISGNTYLGGLVGQVSSTSSAANGPSAVRNSYNLGAIVSEKNYVGGIAGQVQSSTNAHQMNVVENVYSAGSVGGANYNGLLIGHVNNANATVSNAYCLAGKLNGIGTDVGGHTVNAVSAEELAALAPSLGDAFQAGSLCQGRESFPILTWQTPSDHEFVNGICSFCGERVESASAVTVEVMAQGCNAFLLPPQTVTVAADLAESYGYADQVPFYENASALDVIVRVHEVMFGEDFNAETCHALFELGSTGFINTMFGMETSNLGFTVNETTPVSSEPSEWGGYISLTAGQSVVVNSDSVNIFLYQDDWAMDLYTWFTQNGTPTKTIQANAGEAVTIGVKGYSVGWYGYYYQNYEQMLSQVVASPAEDAQLAIVNEDGMMEDITGAVADKDGMITVTFPEAGTYTITAYVSDEAIEDGATPAIMTLATVQVGEAFAITSEPENFVGDVNETASFIVETNRENVTFQWYYSADQGKTWRISTMTGATTDTLTVKMTAARVGQMYRCDVTSESGITLTSQAVSLSRPAVAEKLTIVRQPETFAGQIGDTAAFAAQISGVDVTYQWYYSSDLGKTWNKSGMTGSTTDTLTVQMTKARVGQMYRLQATDCSGEVVTTDAVSLTIAAPETKLAIQTQPESFVGAVNDTAAFHVVAEGAGLSYQWFYSNNGGKSWSRSGLTGCTTDTLTVKLTEARAGQMYKCVITDETGAVVETVAVSMTIGSVAGVTITAQPADHVGAMGSAASFHVEAEGEGLTYQWYYSVNNGAYWSISGMTGSKTDTLNVQMTKARVGQMYKCVITDANGNTAESAAVKLIEG